MEFQHGDKVILQAGGGYYPLFDFYNGETYTIQRLIEDKNDHGSYKEDRPLYCILGRDGRTGFAYVDQLMSVKLTPEKAKELWQKNKINDQQFLDSL